MSGKKLGIHTIIEIVAFLSALATIMGFVYFFYDRHFVTCKPMEGFSSNRDAYYSCLRKLLKENRWEDANRETLRLMLQTVNREGEGFIDTKTMKEFPCKDLLIIEDLWSKASQGRFGFDTQQKIWKSEGGKPYLTDENSEAYHRFRSAVGWKKGKDPNFSLNAPYGHLPILGSHGKIGGIANTYRIAECLEKKEWEAP